MDKSSALMPRKTGIFCDSSDGGKMVLLYMGPGGEGLGRGVRGEAVICLSLNKSEMRPVPRGRVTGPGCKPAEMRWSKVICGERRVQKSRQ